MEEQASAGKVYVSPGGEHEVVAIYSVSRTNESIVCYIHKSVII
jgi:hypothetical protein